MMNNMKLNTNMENLRDIYKEIAERTDIDTAHKIYCAFAGVQVCFPKNFYTSEYVKSQIRTQYAAGTSIKELTRRYNYSERWIRKILSEGRLEDTK
ncbi:Mor transcription activator family protein [Emergencia sp.]|uniref:Mor transcription activator family protein n=1 Tax=Emergencia sp. TaxID=1926557 RepID=UPI003AF01DE2